jgi:peptidoglycan/LPS O-acetylase OafA/YrhL
MKNGKLKLILYEIAVKWRLKFYLAAALLILIPIIIVLVTDNPFSPFYAEVFINTAIAFVIIGKILTAFKKAIEEGLTPWASIGSIIGLLILWIWSALNM